MKKENLIEYVASHTDLTMPQAVQVVTVIFNGIKRTLAAREDVVLRGFGKFKIVKRAQRTARNLKTGEPITIAEHDDLRFVPSKELKSHIRK